MARGNVGRTPVQCGRSRNQTRPRAAPSLLRLLCSLSGVRVGASWRVDGRSGLIRNVLVAPFWMFGEERRTLFGDGAVGFCWVLAFSARGGLVIS